MKVALGWMPMLDHLSKMNSLRCFIRSLAGTAPFDTICQKGQGRGRKLVTENSTPVGSGRLFMHFSKFVEHKF